MKIKGMFKMNGTIAGITYYTSRDMQLARECNPVSGERIKKDMAFAGTRRNMSEFGAASHIAKVLRHGLPPIVGGFKETETVYRLNKHLMSTISAGEGQVGKRAFSALRQQKSLVGFQFRKELSLENLLNADVSISPKDGRGVISTKIRNIVPSTIPRKLKSTSHFRLVSMACVLSDYEFDEATQQYQPLHPNINGASGFTYSAPVKLDFDLFYDVELPVELPVAVQDSDRVGVVSLLGMEFLEEGDGGFVAFRDGAVLEIVGVV